MTTRVLHLSARDRIGGAARAAYRIHQSLKDAGVNSSLLTQRRSMDEANIYGPSGIIGKLYDGFRRKLDQLPVLKYQNRDPELFSPAWVPSRVISQVNRIDPDLIHLHWVTGGFLTPEVIGDLSSPIVWTLHDMWPFTGGCHYAKNCKRYTESCGACPHLGSESMDDLSKTVHQRKNNAWENASMYIVTPSTWLSNQAKQSNIFGGSSIKTIPNPVDTNRFQPRSADKIRSRLGLSEEKLLIGTGADRTTRRKGMDLFYNMLAHEPVPADSAEVLLFGRTREPSRSDLAYDITVTGFVDEKTLDKIYTEIDVLVVSSRQEAFGQTASEALASGTPVVAFDTTGPADIIAHKQTGYLAQPFDSADLANGIKWALTGADHRSYLSRQTRMAAVERFSMPVIAKQYECVYDEMIPST